MILLITEASAISSAVDGSVGDKVAYIRLTSIMSVSSAIANKSSKIGIASGTTGALRLLILVPVLELEEAELEV